ncbi:sulfotransferase [Motilimonas eburnea]|uniref:sulfotransferase n=1 Tax=Motilimonas eburnea TaxID=1737488 RepID=UPI001E408E98
MSEQDKIKPLPCWLPVTALLPKYFILGLPRTATTSVCLATLSLGFRTAHTAYVNRAFEHANVIADTPVFADYAQLDTHFPGAKFIYLNRARETWIPSIRQLLLRMFDNLTSESGGFNPVIKRCYHEIFAPIERETIMCDEHLWHCYLRHQQQVLNYFSERPEDLLMIEVGQPGSYQALYDFMRPCHAADRAGDFVRVNQGGKVTAWKQIKHPLKVESTHQGRVETLFYQKGR